MTQLSWPQERSLILRGPNPGNDPYRLSFWRVAEPSKSLSHGDNASRAHIPWQRTRGGDAEAAGFPYPWQNPIRAGIVYGVHDPLSWDGPPTAEFVQGALFFRYPTPVHIIAEGPQPGGPLYDPATLAAMLAPASGISTNSGLAANDAGRRAYGMSF
jgi:hypothetical protein